MKGLTQKNVNIAAAAMAGFIILMLIDNWDIFQLSSKCNSDGGKIKCTKWVPDNIVPALIFVVLPAAYVAYYV